VKFRQVNVVNVYPDRQSREDMQTTLKPFLVAFQSCTVLCCNPV